MKRTCAASKRPRPIFLEELRGPLGTLGDEGGQDKVVQ